MTAVDFGKLSPAQKADFTDRCWWEEIGHNPDNEVIKDDHWFQIVTRSTPSLMANGVMRCEVKDASIDRRIRDTIELYRSAKLPFHWTVCPSSQPHDLAKRLLAAGMTLGAVHDGIVGDPKKIKAPTSKKVTVEPLSEANIHEYTVLLAHSAYSEDHAVKRLQAQVHHQLAAKRHWVSHFLARLDGVPAGICQNRYHNGYVHQLGGAVKPEYRKNGVLSALLHRLGEDAVEKGFGILVCHAPHHHKSPKSWRPEPHQSIDDLMLSLGYEKTCEYETYFWKPS